MSLTKRVFLVGGHLSSFIGKGHPDFVHPKHPDFGKRTNPTLEDYINRAVNGALEATKTDPKAVDRIFVGNFAGELFTKQGHLGAAAAGAHPDLRFKNSMRVEGACASGALAVSCAFDALRSGSAHIALCVGAEVQTTVSAREGGDFLARASHYSRQRSIDDFTFPCLFARRSKFNVQAGHFTMDDMALVSVKAYANANRNSLAHMHRAKMTFENAKVASEKNPAFLNNAEFKDFLRISDCSQVSDGGAAIVLCDEEGLKRLNPAPGSYAEIATLQVATDNLYQDSDPLRMETSAAAAAAAYADANLRPEQMEVAEVHDCFSTAELLMYEALQFGSAPELIRGGHTTLEGRIPVNTGGGLIGFGHPVGATGIKQLLEIFRQMKGQCGGYQLKKLPTHGVAMNMGGDDKTAVCTILRNL